MSLLKKWYLELVLEIIDITVPLQSCDLNLGTQQPTCLGPSICLYPMAALLDSLHSLALPTTPSWHLSSSSRCWRVNSWLGLLLASAPHCPQPFWSLPRPCTSRWFTKSQTRFALSAKEGRWRKIAGDSMDTRGSGEQDGQKEGIGNAEAIALRLTMFPRK